MFRKSAPEPARTMKSTGSNPGMAASFSVLGADVAVKARQAARAAAANRVRFIVRGPFVMVSTKAVALGTASHTAAAMLHYICNIRPV